MINIIIFVLFILAIAVLVYKDRKNVKREGIVIIRRTKKGKKFIDKIAKSHPKFWNFVSYAVVIAAIPAMIGSSYLIIDSLLKTLSAGGGGAVRLVLPWASPQAELVTGAILVPWYFWVIGIFSVLVPHEMFHGIMSRLEKIKIESLGWVLFVILPGAFVEPNEKKLKNAKVLTRLKVYGAGSFANFIMAGLFFGILTLFGFLFFTAGGVVPSGAIEGYPAAQANISGAIVGINDIDVDTLQDLRVALEKTEPGESILLRTTTGNYTLKTVEDPDNGTKAFIGISGPFETYTVPAIESFSGVLSFFRQLFAWIFILNLGIGLVNMLPIKPLDGGIFLESVLSKYTKKSEAIIKYISIIMALILIFTIFSGFF